MSSVESAILAFLRECGATPKDVLRSMVTRSLGAALGRDDVVSEAIENLVKSGAVFTETGHYYQAANR
jgi:hypothetical protein